MRDWKEKGYTLLMTRWAFPLLLLLTSISLVIFAVSAHKATHMPVFTPLNELIEKELYTPTISQVAEVEGPQEEEQLLEVNIVTDHPSFSQPIVEQHPSQSSCQHEQKININEASNNELQQLTGIGPAKATAIIEYRTTNGRFSSIEQLREVKGIGEKIYERLKESIVAC